MLSRAPFAQGALCLAVCFCGAWSEVAGAESKAPPAQTATSSAPAEGSVKSDAAEAPAPAPAIEPGRGAGQRRVADDTTPVTPATPAKSEPAAPKTTAPKRPAHQQGRAPQRPSPTLPPGAERASPDREARRTVVGGPTDDDLTAGNDDPELRALREAERVLFAKPLQGVQPGWSWELPKRIDQGGPSVHASGIPPSGSSASADLASPAVAADWLRRLRMPDLGVRLEPRVIKYLEFYRDDPRGRQIARVWAKKSGRLLPALKAEFARAGLPTDLVWLSLIESGHNPTIVSPAGAAGLWQFIPESGRMYGLTVDRWVDERLDPERSTEAAIRYLKDLHGRFGNWELAMAAYNMGHGGLLRAVRKFNTNDFWALSRYEAGIPWETTLYVPKILAIAVVMNNRDTFAIDDIEPDPAINFDTVYVEKGTTISEVAQAAQVPEQAVRELNAQYLAGRTPPDPTATRFRVRVPAGRGVAATEALAKTSAQGPKGIESYVVRYGDTLSAIARERGTSERSLRQLNGTVDGEKLFAGTILLVPARADAPEVALGDPPVVVVPARRFGYQGKRRIFYETLPGDTIERIGRAFSASSSDLAAWNAVDVSASLQPGMILQLYVDPQADLARTRYLREDEVRVITAGSDEFFEYFEGLNGRRRIVVTAKDGDTLSTIGGRYGMSTGMMERINRFSRSKKLEAGERIVVYAKGPVVSGGEGIGPAPLAEVVSPLPEALPPLDRSTAAPNGTRSAD